MDLKYTEKTLTRKDGFKGRALHVTVDEVILPNGQVATREVIRDCHAVAILAVDELERVLLEKQYRYPYDDFIYEIPSGKAEKGEEEVETGKREFKEETGYTTRNFELLGSFYPSAGYSDEDSKIYLATGLEKGEAHLDSDEELTCAFIPLKEVLEMVNRGEIKEGRTLAAIAYYLAKRVNL